MASPHQIAGGTGALRHVVSFPTRRIAFSAPLAALSAFQLLTTMHA